jgi:hypothetical protein
VTGRPAAPRIAGWEVLGRVGAGAMGSVWKARRASDGVLAAVKVAEPGTPLAAHDAAAHFRRESLACLNLDHPHLVRGLDVGTTDDGRPYLAMEFVAGPTLARAVQDGGPLPEPRLLAVATALARALDHVHRQGLVHRDVKPSNVLLGEGGAVKLADLGLVVETAGGPGSPRMGTRPYLAPEVLAGGEGTARSDLYALGATLAEAALGERREDAGAWTDAHLPADVRGAPLSQGLRSVVERLVRAQPSQRYASAAELVLDLDAVAAGERPLGAILGAGAAAVPRTRRAWTAVGAVVFAGAGAAAFVWTRDAVPPPAVALPPADVPSAPTPDPRLAAARVYSEQYPEDFPRLREILAAADTPALTDAERADLSALRAATDARFIAAADAEAATRRQGAAQLDREGDVPGAQRVLLEWPAHLAGAPQHDALVRGAGTALKLAQVSARFLAERVEADLRGEVREASTVLSLRAELADVLARPPFEGDQRARLLAAQAQLDEIARAKEAEWATTEAAMHAELDWSETVREAARTATRETTAELLRRAAAGAAPERLREPARRVADAAAAADAALASAFAGLRGRTWAGPRGGTLFVGRVDEPPAPEEVLLSPLWRSAGGDEAAIARLAGGADRVGPWLLVAGEWGRAMFASEDVRRVVEFAQTLPSRPVPRAVDDENARRVGLTLRPVGARGAGTALRDPVLGAWEEAASSPKRPPPAKAAAPAKAAGRDAFLADDLGTAWTALSEAAQLDPWDAETAALRARVLLAAARPLPTAPVLLLAFSEGRRAADLDPKLPAGHAVAAEAGLDLCLLVPEEFARRVRPLAAAACEEATLLGREDARFLLGAGAWHLAEGRDALAVERLRRAVAKGADTGAAFVLLARAELAVGRKDRARDALRRAVEAFGGTLPEDAADLAAQLEK